MKPISRTAVCTVLFLISLGTALAQQVKTDFDHQANFSQYKTYSWQTIKPANSLWDSRIKSAVDALSSKKEKTKEKEEKAEEQRVKVKISEGNIDMPNRLTSNFL